MPQPLRLAADPGSDQEAMTWLHHVDDAFLACRGNHNFPKLRLTGGKLPDGIRADRQRDRSYQITETCPDCGVKRTYSTIPGGWLGYGETRHYTYVWPDGYRMPHGAATYIGISDCRAELWRRTVEVLDAEADRRARRRKPKSA